ncbi:hypothetical protein [Nodularia spumigena]|uniref:hypothetical protein n=1 Tax=Nodularia spumigena TaxID=70799 RepID=UPI002B21DEBB|nr:hypothetical protein [Nodularia spumigena]MEA5612320.1 hypothetical protein [Nodularia spumigena UHCC 0040]
MGFSPPVLLMLFGWPVLMGVLAIFIPARRAAAISIIGGNLFLPVAGISLPGLPDYTKPFAAGLGALVAALIGATPKLLSWRPRLIDVFFLAFMAAPGVSSILNGLGGYDAASSVVNQFLSWGVSYWIGRSLFDSHAAIKELAAGFVIGGMLYAPLCVWESVMSPQLHVQLYGYRPSSFIMAKRLGGWRPMVFMQHGLAVGAWMASSAIVAWILWRGRVVSSVLLIPISFVAIGLVAVTIGLRSTGAAILVVALICAVEFVQITRIRLAVLALLLAPAGYIGLRVAGWEGQELVAWAFRFDEERAGSLEVRLVNDAMIVDRAMQQPIFGWGGWGRWRVKDEFGRDITISDSWWGILVGTTGVFGLVAAYGAFIAPMFVLIRRKRSGRIFSGGDGAAWALGFAVMLFVIDTLANAMPNASFLLASGAICTFILQDRNFLRVSFVKDSRGEPVRTSSKDIDPEQMAPTVVDLR